MSDSQEHFTWPEYSITLEAIDPSFDWPSQRKELQKELKWSPKIALGRNNLVSDLPTYLQLALNEAMKPTSNDVFQGAIWNTKYLPQQTKEIIDGVSWIVNMPTNLHFLINKNENNRGNAWITIGSWSTATYFTDEAWLLNNFEYTHVNSTLVIDRLGSHPRNNIQDQYKTMLHEYGHLIQRKFFSIYREKYLQSKIWTPKDQILRWNPLRQDVFSDFYHPLLPLWKYTHGMFDELYADTLAYSYYPEKVPWRYTLYGGRMRSIDDKQLCWAFVEKQLSNFLSERGYGDYSIEDIHRVMEKYYEYHKSWNDPMLNLLRETYHLNDPDFFAYIQAKYLDLGIALSQHMKQKLRNLPQ